MNTSTSEGVLRYAINAGLVPPTATLSGEAERPWPVVVLTALGAWIVVIPLLGVVGLMLESAFRVPASAYIIGAVLTIAAVAMLARTVPLFVEQLAVPLGLAGLITFGYALFRDLPDEAAAVLFAALCIGIAVILKRPWLRVIFGVASGCMLLFAAMPKHWQPVPYELRADITLHLLMAIALVALWLQRYVLERAARPTSADLVDSLASGWVIVALTGLAFWSGMSFMIGASLGGGFLGGRPIGNAVQGAFDLQIESTLSVVLAFAAAALLARAWPSLRHAPEAIGAIALAILAWFMPALGAIFLIAVMMFNTGRIRLCALSAVAALWILGSFYYQLQWSLSTKALLLALAGAVFGVIAGLKARRLAQAQVSAASSSALRRLGLPEAALGLAATLVFAIIGYGVWNYEQLIAHGRPVYLELGAIDPRSLMQGDFIALRFKMPLEMGVYSSWEGAGVGPLAIARRDERGVATLVRIAKPGEVLQPDEFFLQLAGKNGARFVVTDAWYFREGDGARWAASRYGEFRVAESGKALLVGMADKDLHRIAP